MGISSVLIHMFYVCSARMRTKGQHSVNGKAVDIQVLGFGHGASRGWFAQTAGSTRERNAKYYPFVDFR